MVIRSDSETVLVIEASLDEPPTFESNTPHTLGEEFPGKIEAIHALKAKSPHFARILEQYDTVNDRIHRAETGIEPMGDDEENCLRRQRLAIKDRIVTLLAA